ncbi:MAG: hypothetical protein JNL28_00485 [Planctomycetes bacterium]|nr:hypothetical protein [Planctomycetota bacterium]
MLHRTPVWIMVLAAALFASCSGETGSLQSSAVESCMQCHNGTLSNDYSGPGIENPHPFAGADNIRCTVCHGGNPAGDDMAASHVPPPPQIGDDAFQTTNAKAYFNRLTLAGMDKFPDYSVGGRTYTAIDYLQFINPGDLRVTSNARGCGQCHTDHANSVADSLLATEAGVWSGANFAIGADSLVPENQALHNGTAADMGFRARTNPAFNVLQAVVGAIGRVIEVPVYSVFGQNGGNNIFNNNAYLAAGLDDDRDAQNRVISGSPLANLFIEQVSFTCGDCHLGSAGANNRAGDFRSSGCSACHMPYSLSGRSGSSDPNINKIEPVDPDDIDAPERSHARSHRIASVKKTGTDGKPVPGMDDATCAGCHQGSNRTVMQYWGIRLDQNADVRNNRQYPANPVSNQGTHNDPRLFDAVVDNNTFNGRNGNQYLLTEDYDGDGRDDTPPDVHYDAGLGCIDCHGSHDMHGGKIDDPDRPLLSRMEQNVSIQCSDCHGGVDTYAPVQPGTTYEGTVAEVGVDSKGNPMRHVTRDANGRYWLKSRLTGQVHYVPQTKDTIVNSGKLHPQSGQPIFNAKASYAMGRIDNTATNGTGPKQTAGVGAGFAHTDRMDCVSCHASWTNTCMGCHLSGEYNTGNNFSNVTGERIVFRQRTADFTYQSPLFFQLGVNARGRITQFSANTKVFFQWKDKNNQLSRRFGFSDKNASGTGPGTSGYPSLSHNAIMAHSIRGRVTATKEGPRYCVACHMTTSGIANFGPQYDTFRNALAAGNFGALDFNLLKQHFGRNTSNQMNSPFFAHMAAGLGTGLFLFDEFGAPVNPLDTHTDRKGTDNVPPSTVFDPARVYYDLDRIVQASGVANGSNNHTFLDPNVGPSLRDGATDAHMAGPLGASIIRLLADPVNGLVLDSWLDANGAAQGDAATFLGGP